MHETISPLPDEELALLYRSVDFTIITAAEGSSLNDTGVIGLRYAGCIRCRLRECFDIVSGCDRGSREFAHRLRSASTDR